jgi:hypothetical protein
VLVSASGCTDYVFRLVTPESTKEVKATVAAAKPTPVDILFVVDNSGSMADEQTKLARNFDRFLEVLSRAPDNDYQLGVVSTDLSSLNERGEIGEWLGEVEAVPSSTPPFVVGPADRSRCTFVPTPYACFRGDAARIIPSSLPREQQLAAFQSAVRIGSCGSGAEEGLRAMITALENTAVGRCNAGFLRPEANLVVVIVSDEENNPAAREAMAAPPERFAEQLVALKGSAGQVRVALIVGAVDGQASRCGTGASCGVSACAATPPPDSGAACATTGRCVDPAEVCDRIADRCVNAIRLAQREPMSPGSVDLQCSSCSYFATPDCCSAVAGTAYVAFAKAVEARVAAADPSIPVSGCRAASGPQACIVESICQAEFGDTLARIARELVIGTSFSIEPPAKYPPGVVVEVDGRALVNCSAVAAGAPCDFTVEDDGRRVRLKAPPPEGAQLDVFFVVSE